MWILPILFHTVAFLRFTLPGYSQNEPLSTLSVNLVLDAATSGTIAHEIVVQITASVHGGDTATGKVVIGSQLEVVSL